MIEEWLAGTAAKIIGGVLVVLGLICTPVAIYQHFEIAGFSLWLPVAGKVQLFDGLRDAAKERDAALHDLKVCHGNTDTLQSALDAQNKKILGLKAAGDAQTARANAAIAALAPQQRAAEALSARILAAKPGADVCKSADQLILEVVK